MPKKLTQKAKAKYLKSLGSLCRGLRVFLPHSATYTQPISVVGKRYLFGRIPNACLKYIKNHPCVHICKSCLKPGNFPGLFSEERAATVIWNVGKPLALIFISLYNIKVLHAALAKKLKIPNHKKIIPRAAQKRQLYR